MATVLVPATERERDREGGRKRENNIEKYGALVSVVRYARCESGGERERELGVDGWRMRAREGEEDGKTKMGREHFQSVN